MGIFACVILKNELFYSGSATMVGLEDKVAYDVSRYFSSCSKR